MSSVDPASSSASNSTSNNKPAADDDLDPAAFLKSVRELSEKREREDAERYRRLEEEVEKGRRERAARREERARSISPQKTAIPPKTLEPSINAIDTDSVALETDTMETAAPESPTKDIPEFKGFASEKTRAPSVETAASSTSESSGTRPSQSASSLARSGTLSWQQRPSSRGTGSRPRSVVLSDSDKQVASAPSNAASDGTEPSRDQIAASLGSRDPSWFRQTADRGLGNAAYRKSKEESVSGDNFVSGRRGLPGLSREPQDEPQKLGSPTPSESFTSDTASRTGSVKGSTTSSGAFSTVRTSTSSKPDLKSLVAADEGQEKASPMSDRTSSVTDGEQAGLGRTLTMSSSQARLANATERPASPTKGMGGFVQSAMMKRSDSVNKRWSAQPGPSLSRENSSAGARSGYGGLQGSFSMPKLEPTPASREGSNEPLSRPSSSSSNLTNLTLTQGKDDKDIFVKPSLPRSHSRSKSIASNYSTTAEEGHASPPSSPSKRWSPSKSTWLESAITKPDTPKPAPAARNSQPSWMVDIAKAKAQRGSADITPKPSEEQSSRPGSPSKAPFGQGMLKRSESKDLGIPRSTTPKIPGDVTPRSLSPTKNVSGQSSLSRSQSRDLDIASKGVSQQPTTADLSASRPAASQADPEPVREAQPKPDPEPEPEHIVTAAAGKHETTSKMTTMETPLKSPPMSTTKPKPETPPKPQTDFRNNLRARPPSDAKQQNTPEFLSRFGNLRKTQTQNYVAPDVLKDNITRGKSDLSRTGGPVKTQRRDELKESLLAKKDQWKTEKEQGVVHERKVSTPPQTPQKPEALAKRELLGRSESVKAPASPEKPKTATPEALARHKSLREKPKLDVPSTEVNQQGNAPVSSSGTVVPGREIKQPSETSKLAARFNPGLANILVRGPPAANGSNAPSRSDSPAVPQRIASPAMSPPSEPSSDGARLQDMRKGRAKGPKRRKGGAATAEVEEPVPPPRDEPIRQTTTLSLMSEEPQITEKPKPRAVPGSAASLMISSLQRSNATTAKTSSPVDPRTSTREATSSTPKATNDKPSIPAKSPSVPSARHIDTPPATPAKSPAFQAKSTMFQQKALNTPSAQQSNDIPEFSGFSSAKKSTPALRLVDENKENAGEASPSVKSSASTWGKPPSPKKTATPAQIQLPSRKDEEAAMRSAGLLASSPSRPGSSNGLGISEESAGASTEKLSVTSPPQKPEKSSQAISGQLQEASSSRGLASSDTESRLQAAFGSVPRYSGPLSVDVHALIASSPHQERVFRTLRKAVYVVAEDGSLNQLPQQEEYTFFDKCVYVCHHTYSIGDSAKKNEIFLWTGTSSGAGTVEQAQAGAKKLAKDAGNAFAHTVRQGMEPPGFLQALGGILVTRRGSREGASKQYMLCGRKHLGQIVFDEVDFGINSLCSGFPYLISHPFTLQDTKLYLWKGSACSSEELSGARLAAMDLSETRDNDIIEVDDGAEFASFLKIFGQGTTKASIPKATDVWHAKAMDSHRFASRLFRVQPQETKQGFFGGMFARRPSWNSQSPSRRQSEDVKVTAQEISPFTQADLDVDGIYMLDAHSQLHVLVGPMFASQPESVRNVLLGQTLTLASEYAVVATSTEDRPAVPKGFVLLSGVPPDVKMLFRHYDEGAGLWGTAGLMAGLRSQDGVQLLGLEDVLDVVCDE